MNITFLEDETGEIEFHDDVIDDKIQKFYKGKFKDYGYKQIYIKNE